MCSSRRVRHDRHTIWRNSRIERELIREGLAAICEEMAVSVLRTSHSETVKSAMDFSTALCDETGQIIAQGITLPNQLGALPEAVAAILRRFRGDFHPGDVAMVNDPFDGGMHLPDIFVVRPVYYDSEFVGTGGDGGASRRSGWNGGREHVALCGRVFQEGLRIPPVKLISRREARGGNFRPAGRQHPGAGHRPGRLRRPTGGVCDRGQGV